MNKSASTEPKIVLEKGKPASVILDLAYYQKLLERVEDVEDLNELKQLKKQKLNFRPFVDFLASR